MSNPMTNEQRIALLEQAVAELRGLIAQWVQERQQHTLKPGNALDVTLRVVDRHMLINRSLILSPSRLDAVVMARWAVMWLLLSRFKLSQNRIGILLGKDHATVSFALRKLAARRDQCRSYSLALTACERELDHMLQPVNPQQQAAA